MDIHQLVFLAIVTALSAVAGYRSQLNGWILLVGFFEIVLRIIWVVVCVAIVILWCTQFPISAILLNVAYFLTAICVPFWLGKRLVTSIRGH